MMILWLLGCSGVEKETGELNPPFIPDMPISECGLEEYSWLSTETMGEIISVDQPEEFSLTSESLATLLAYFDLSLPDPIYDVETYYIQYKSQDKGNEVAVTGLAAFPVNKEGDTPILLWPHPTMGFNDSCAPTATGVFGAAYPVLFASLGFAVIAPDYLGMSGWIGSSEELHPYVIAEPTALISIDSVRALQHLIERKNIKTNIDPNQLVVWGVSEGGYAALFIDRYLPHYAPEFQSIATVATIPATDPFWLAQHGVQNFGPTTAGILGAQVTMRQWYQNSTPLTDILQPPIADIAEDQLATNCTDFDFLENLENVDDIYTSEYIDNIINDSTDGAPWSCFLKENALHSSKIPLERVAPTYITTAELDDLAIPDPVHRDISLLCEQGYQIEHRQCAGADHVDGALDSIMEQWNWIQDRLNGIPISNVCEIQSPQPCID
jgi:hypothetical protein